jgi:hypothetical protein
MEELSALLRSKMDLNGVAKGPQELKEINAALAKAAQGTPATQAAGPVSSRLHAAADKIRQAVQRQAVAREMLQKLGENFAEYQGCMNAHFKFQHGKFHTKQAEIMGNLNTAQKDEIAAMKQASKITADETAAKTARSGSPPLQNGPQAIDSDGDMEIDQGKADEELRANLARHEAKKFEEMAIAEAAAKAAATEALRIQAAANAVIEAAAGAAATKANAAPDGGGAAPPVFAAAEPELQPSSGAFRTRRAGRRERAETGTPYSPAEGSTKKQKKQEKNARRKEDLREI